MADANSKKPMALLLLVVVAVLVVIIMSEPKEKVTGNCTKITETCSDKNIKDQQECQKKNNTWTPKTEKVDAKDKDACKTNGGEWAYNADTEQACKKIEDAKWHPAECKNSNLKEDECKEQNKWTEAVCK